MPEAERGEELGREKIYEVKSNLNVKLLKKFRARAA